MEQLMSCRKFRDVGLISHNDANISRSSSSSRHKRHKVRQPQFCQSEQILNFVPCHLALSHSLFNNLPVLCIFCFRLFYP